MAINTEKNTYTLLFAIGLVVIVGTLLAAIDASLRIKLELIRHLKNNKIFYTLLELMKMKVTVLVLSQLKKQRRSLISILPSRYIFKEMMLWKMIKLI